MKTNVFLWAILVLALSFNACNKEDSLMIYQDDLVPEVEQTETDLDAYAHLEESVQTLIRSLEISLQALPANINQIELSPTGAINPNGETRLAIATGSFTSALPVKVQSLTDGENLTTGTIIGTGMMGFSNLAIPAYAVASNVTNRVLGFFYWGSTNQWELFHFETQAPNGTVDPGVGSFFITSDHNPGANMPGKGFKYTVRVQGEHPNIFLRSAIANNILVDGTYILAGSGTSQNPSSALIEVPSNDTGKNRTIDLQYSLDMFTWITISTGIQVPSHYVLNSGRIVAKEDYQPGNTFKWHQAMGIPSTYTYSNYRDAGIPDYTHDFTLESGCRAYSEPGHPAGTWRLPTYFEGEEMSTNRKLLGLLDNGSSNNILSYWVNHEVSKTEASAIWSNSQSGTLMTYTHKNWSTDYVRCVRTVK